MIHYKLNVPGNINYLSDWNELELLLPKGKVILNKSICGCGCTEAFLTNGRPIILVSPRCQLISCKMNKPGRAIPLFYFDRTKGCGVDVQTSIAQMDLYITNPTPGFVPKILSTYDSLKIVLDHLIQKGWLEPFTIIVDEFPCLFTDAKLKGEVELTMIKRLSPLPNDTVFVSATPIKDIYLDETPEFRNVPIYDLVWPAEKIHKIMLDRQIMRNARESCGKVIEEYLAKGFFKSTIVNGCTVYSKEALFFLNNVKDILAIIKKYKLTSVDTVVICSEENERKLSMIGFKIGHPNNELTYKTENKPFTFITKASFEGTDFYSDTGSVYVFANPGVESMGIDISIDLPQIAGRIRTQDNPFKDVITFFYKTSLEKDIKELELKINNRIRATDCFFSKYANMDDVSLLEKIRSAQKAEKYQSDYIDVIQTVDGTGKPVWSIEKNIYAKLADLRGIEILRGQYNTSYTVFVSAKDNGFSTNDPLDGSNGNEVKEFYLNFIRDNNFVRKMELYVDFLNNNPTKQSEVEAIPQIPMEYKIYYNNLSTERMKALGYREKAMKAEIRENQSFHRIQTELTNRLIVGNAYTAEYLKTVIQQVYDELKILRIAKGTDLKKYIPTAKNIIMKDKSGKRKKGFRI